MEVPRNRAPQRKTQTPLRRKLSEVTVVHTGPSFEKKHVVTVGAQKEVDRALALQQPVPPVSSARPPQPATLPGLHDRPRRIGRGGVGEQLDRMELRRGKELAKLEARKQAKLETKAKKEKKKAEKAERERAQEKKARRGFKRSSSGSVSRAEEKPSKPGPVPTLKRRRTEEKPDEKLDQRPSSQ